MSSEIFDVIIIGVGAHGSCSAYHLSLLPNLRVLAIDQFCPPHTYGSSHGETRITRQIYFEHPAYVPLVRRSYPLWERLAEEAKTSLFVKTGGLYLGEEGSRLMKGLRLTAETHNFLIKTLAPSEIMERFPAFRVPENLVGIYDETAGILFPEKCIEAAIEGARKRGVVFRFNERAVGIRSEGGLEVVETEMGVYKARKVIVTAGAYINGILTDLGIDIKVEKKKIFWSEPDEARRSDFSPQKMPIFLIEDPKTHTQMYGFPDIVGTGVKSAVHVDSHDFVESPGQIERVVTKEDVAGFRDKFRVFFPHGFSKLNKWAVCMYTMTPDEHFILDFHPRNRNVIVASPCSGHGFKFAIVIGEILKDLAINGKSEFDLGLFSINRPALRKQPLAKL